MKKLVQNIQQQKIMFSHTVPYTSGQSLPYNYYYIYNYSEITKMINSTFNYLMTIGKKVAYLNCGMEKRLREL